MFTIVVDQLLIKIALYDNLCSESITKLYKYPGKCDDKQQYKAILEAAMVCTTDGLAEKSQFSLSTPVPIKNPSARKPLYQFSAPLDVK